MLGWVPSKSQTIAPRPQSTSACYCASSHFAYPFATYSPLPTAHLCSESPSNASYSIFSSSTPPHASCLLPLFFSMAIPPFTFLAIVICLGPPCRAPSVSPASVFRSASFKGRQDTGVIMSWISSQGVLVEMGHQGTCIRECPLDHLLLLGHCFPPALQLSSGQTVPCPLPGHDLYLTSPALFASNFFFLFFDCCVGNLARKRTNLWAERPGNT